jgi:hypothetical protein
MQMRNEVDGISVMADENFLAFLDIRDGSLPAFQGVSGLKTRKSKK